MLKKIGTFILIIIFMFSFTGCFKDKKESQIGESLRKETKIKPKQYNPNIKPSSSSDPNMQVFLSESFGTFLHFTDFYNNLYNVCSLNVIEKKDAELVNSNFLTFKRLLASKYPGNLTNAYGYISEAVNHSERSLEYFNKYLETENIEYRGNALKSADKALEYMNLALEEFSKKGFLKNN